ncbi:unannotated protein [freshwater metagenome]|uniref:Unannotated protein n=1 Tax=freshwater metagenome TaxID=449393 RepID=A0A6J7HM61_9ZZZZ|nr:DegV family EDD domain-containing protein [Actinomycetota bacterium]
MPVAVVTDSTTYLPRAVADEAGLHQVSLYVNMDGKSVPEADLPDYTHFYDGLRTAASLPTTSQPSVGDFLAIYEPLMAQGNDIVSIHLSGGISGTVEAARQAAEQAMADNPQRRIEVIDSRSACGGAGLVALAAAAAVRGGGNVDQVADRARRAVDTFGFWFAVDTLEFLQRGGRIGLAQAWIGTALRVKPILTFQDGQMAPVERVRTSRRAFERMVELLRSRAADGLTAWVVQHIQDPETAARLVEAGTEVMGCPPVFVSEIGPVIGTHTGPGLLGAGSMAPELLSERL